MVDWFYVVRSALSTLGAGLALAALSYAIWWAAGQGLSVREVLIQRPFAVACAAGSALFCLGVAAGAARLWERGLWLVLALAFAWVSAASWRETSGSA